MTDYFCQTVEEAGKAENTSLLGYDMGTGKQKGQCCGEDRVHWTHGRKEARPYEEKWP